MPTRPWIWTSNLGLDQRASALLPQDGDSGTSVVECENATWLTEAVACMRQGQATQSLTGSGLTGEIQWLAKHVPNSGVFELWAGANNAGTPAFARRVDGTWSAVTISDALKIDNLRYTHSASFNGKHFIAYDSDVNRLHVWDGTSMRRVGIDKPSAPTVADVGVGTYAATARRYRVIFLLKSGSDVIAQSELSDATSTFTPSGTGGAARVTRPTTPDSATHWAVYAIAGSTDTYTSYQKISSDIAVATTTYDDLVAPASYLGALPASLGLNIPPPSAKFIIEDGSRLIMAGAWETAGSTSETTPKANRVWFTRVLGSSDLGDDESIPNTTTLKYWVDIGDAGPITGLAGPIYGQVFVFKESTVWKLVPTGDVDVPYQRIKVSDAAGAVDQRCIVTAEESGKAAIYFADVHAIYRLSGAGQLATLGEQFGVDMRATRFTASQSLLLYSQDQRQLIAIASSAPRTITGAYSSYVLDVVKSRWGGLSIGSPISGWILGVSILGTSTTLATGNTIIAGVFSLATSGERRLLIGGQTSAGASSLRAYAEQCVLDGSNAFTMRIRCRKIFEWGRRVALGAPTLWYRNPQGSTSGTLTLTVSYIREDSDTISQSITLTPTTDESNLEFQQTTLEGLQAADISVADVRVQLSYSGTAFTSVVGPTIDALIIPIVSGEKLAT